jgi:hypothetical protein
MESIVWFFIEIETDATVLARFSTPYFPLCGGYVASAAKCPKRR